MTMSLPLPFVPELAARYGLQEAVMLAVVMELVGARQGSVVVDEKRFYRRAGISRQQQNDILAKLSKQGVVTIGATTNDMVNIHLQLDAQAIALSSEGVTQPPPMIPKARQPATGRPPKPSTLASQSGRNDELSRIFAEKEAQQAMQVVMHAEWQPSVNILRMLSQNMQISEAFSMGLKDEFVVYYMDKERRESPGGWDQKFLKWVKKEHVQKQTATARAQQQTQSRNYAHNEEARYHAREKRQQLTDAVLDLGNTDW
ncbi:MAG: hypothetical protein GY905_06920 [Gammaproteobacteria bacterium]|nr:hypothetical protein [Gammaproteobacteria bacterium]MDP6166986.1 DnaT-like ssDNA-binding domain-containing protein [Gammaproteobacteria bacterium]